MNFDQLKVGDEVYYGFLGENDGFVRHTKISNIRDWGYLQFRDNNGGEFIVFANEKKTTQTEYNGNIVSTNEQQAIKWVERKLKKRVIDAKKLYNSREFALMDFCKKYKS
jgi:hypothetical protein